VVHAHGSSEVGSIRKRSAAEAGTVNSFVEVPSDKTSRSSYGLKICLPCENPFFFLPSKPAIRMVVAPGTKPELDPETILKTPSLIWTTRIWPRLALVVSGMKEMYPAGTGLPLNVTVPEICPSFGSLEQPTAIASSPSRHARRPALPVIARPPDSYFC